MTEPTGGNPKSSLWQKYRPSGLTVILVLIVGYILVGLLLPPLPSSGPRAKMHWAGAQIGAFKAAFDMFKLDNGFYPTGANGLNDLVMKPAGATNWHQYLEMIPADPWEHPYIYECPGKHRPDSYDLSSAGPDGKVGTEDDIVNWR